MKNGTRIFLIILCGILIALSAAGVIWAIANKVSNKAYAEEIQTEEIVNFNQQVQNQYINFTATDGQTIPVSFYSGICYIRINVSTRCIMKIQYASTYYSFTCEVGNNTFLYNIAYNTSAIQFNIYGSTTEIKNFNIINLTIMGLPNYTIEQCNNLFTAPYYQYTSGTPMYLSGFEQYAQGAQAMRESMTINVASATIADNLDNVVINSSYGSDSKSLIQGYMVWGSSTYSNCTALINLQTNFNEGDYFEFEFYTITGADTVQVPNITTFYDLQIIAVDSSGNIVPLTDIKAQNNANSTTKASFYLPFSTDKLYITTPHKYIVGYNNFIINMTTTNLTALSLYSYNDGYRNGRGQGYTAGYNKGISEQNATLGTMEYIGAAFSGIGTILSIELLPGVPFSLFVLLPLMFGLIAFVIKLTKGGS